MAQLIAYSNKSNKLDRTVDNLTLRYISSRDWKNMRSIGGWDDWSNMPISETPEILQKNQSEYFSTKLFYKRQDLEVTTSEGSFVLDVKLHNIYLAIRESKVLLNLADDWDDEDAIGCNPIIYDRAINLLLKYSQNVLRYHSVSIDSPEINLVKDGSIDLEWRCKDRILLINILNVEGFEAHYYGCDLNNDTIIKGSIKNYTINRNLSFWMQSLV